MRFVYALLLLYHMSKSVGSTGKDFAFTKLPTIQCSYDACVTFMVPSGNSGR